MEMDMANERLLRLKTGAIEETRKLLGIFIYFWVLLSLFSFHKALVLNEESLIYHQGFALINALALAKVVLLGEYFHVGDNLENRPLIYPIIFKSAVFAVLLICFHIIEETLIGVFHGKTLSQSIPNFGGGTLQGILMVGIIMFVVLMPFFAFVELDRAIGTEELRSLLFGGKTTADAASSITRGPEEIPVGVALFPQLRGATFWIVECSLGFAAIYLVAIGTYLIIRLP
jgi:hypothetical protein